MALRDYKAPKETVTFEGGCFDIRGISFSNLSVLIREHFSDLEMVYKILMESETGDGEIDFQSVIAAVVSNCPQLIARIICISADEDDEQGYDAAYNLELLAVSASTLALASAAFLVNSAMIPFMAWKLSTIEA